MSTRETPAFPPAIHGVPMFKDDSPPSGLTKREYAAIHLAAAYISTTLTSKDKCVRRGIEAADLLLEELEK